MSRTGECLDNASMERLDASLKKEFIHQQTFTSRAQAKAVIFEYIEVFYNWQRRHSAIGYITPEQAFQNMALEKHRIATITELSRIRDEVHFVDGGYAGPKLRGALDKVGDWIVEIVKHSDTAVGFEVIPRRWVVERTFAWLARFCYTL